MIVAPNSNGPIKVIGRRRIVFVNRYFFPDHSATSQILSDLAFHLSATGLEVRVVTSAQLYDRPDANLPRREVVGGVDIHRVATSRFGRRSLLGRAFDYLSFYVSAGWDLLTSARRDDVVVAKTDPPMLSVLIVAVAQIRGFTTVNWLQDLYPEIARELGVKGLGGRLGKWLQALRDASLRWAAMNVVVGEDMAARLGGAGIAAGSLRVIPNWTDDDAIQPAEPDHNPLRTAWELEGRFVVAYSGNLGRAHDVETLLGAAALLSEDPRIIFLFVGAGRGLSEVEAAARNRRLVNISYRPYQPRDQLSDSLGAADVHWLSLRPGLDGLALPSKFYGIAAAGRPIILVGSEQGEFAELLARSNAGVCIAPGDCKALAETIVALADDPDRRHSMGVNARLMLEAGLTKGQTLERWRALLESVATR